MSADNAPLFCTHVEITELLPAISSARFRFHLSKAEIGTGITPVDPLDVMMPFQVLVSVAQVLPQLLEDMDAAGANKTIFTVVPDVPTGSA